MISCSAEYVEGPADMISKEEVRQAIQGYWCELHGAYSVYSGFMQGAAE